MADDLKPASSGEFLTYQTEHGRSRVQVRVEGETVWLSQKAMAEIFHKDVRTISERIRNLFDEGELEPDPVIRNFRTTAADGKQDVGIHIRNVFDERELSPEATVKESLTVQREGSRQVERRADHHNLDVIVSDEAGVAGVDAIGMI